MTTITAASVKELREKTGVGMMDCKKALQETNGDFDAAIKFLREKGLAKASKKADRSTNEGKIFVSVSGNKAVILELNCETDFVASNDGFSTAGDQLAQEILNQNIETRNQLESATIAGKSFNEFVSEKVMQLGENINVGKFEIVSASGNIATYIHSNGKIGTLVLFSQSVDEETGRDVAMHVAAAAPAYLEPSEVPTAELDKEKDILRNQMVNEGKPAQVIDKIVEGKISKYYKEICLVEQAFIKDQDKAVKNVVPSGVKIEGFRRYALV